MSIELRAFAGPAGELRLDVREPAELPEATMELATQVVQRVYDVVNRERDHPTIASLDDLEEFVGPLRAMLAGVDELFHQGAEAWRETSRREARAYLDDARATMLAWRAETRQALYACAVVRLGSANKADIRRCLLASFPDAYGRRGLVFLRPEPPRPST